MAPLRNLIHLRYRNVYQPACQPVRAANKKTGVIKKYGGGRSRTGVREPSALGSTCLADSSSLIICFLNRQGKQATSPLNFSESAPDRLHRDLVFMTSELKAQALSSQRLAGV